MPSSIHVADLVRVHDRPHALYAPVEDVERHHADHAAVRTAHQRARLTVHHGALEARLNARAGLAPGCERARHARAAGHRPRQGGDLAAAVAVQHHVVGEQLLEALHVAVARGREEALRELLLLLARRVEAAAMGLDVAARPGGQLARVVLALA